MGTTYRQLPKSNPTRKKALNKATLKLANPGPDGVVITAPTSARLIAINNSYNNATILKHQRRAELNPLIVVKTDDFNSLRKFSRHFVGVFNFGIDRGKYPKGDRSYYGLDVSDESMPALTTEDDALDFSQEILNGDPLRVLAGGAAMVNPDATEVLAARTSFVTSKTAASIGKEILDNAQEALNTLNDEADKVIKKVWDEVETFYNEETAESMRANAREWGVFYISQGAESTINFTVVDKITQAPLEGAEITILETEKTFVTGADGKVAVTTRVFGDSVEFVIQYLDFDKIDLSLEIIEGSTQDVTVEVE